MRRSLVLRGALGFLGVMAVVQPLAIAKTASHVLPRFAESTLRLPDGRVLTTKLGGANVADWKDIRVDMQILGVDSQHPYGESVVGNHSQIISQMFVTTPSGKAWFALNKRTPPAALHSTAVSYEYWLAIARRPHGEPIAYCIEATVIGNRAKALAETMQLAAAWRVPAN